MLISLAGGAACGAKSAAGPAWCPVAYFFSFLAALMVASNMMGVPIMMEA